MSAEYRLKNCSPSPVMLTFPYEWKIFESDEPTSPIKGFIGLFSFCLDESEILPVVEYLVDNGSLVNSKEELHSPLHYAVSETLTKTTAFLIEKGANVNHIGNSQLTPLLVYNWDGKVCMLILWKRNVSQRDTDLNNVCVVYLFCRWSLLEKTRWN